MQPVANFRAPSPEECEVVQLGDRVRSYDFEFSAEHFVEGTVMLTSVMAEGCPRYCIAVDGVGDVYPPVNGTPHSFGGYCNGVRKL